MTLPIRSQNFPCNILGCLSVIFDGLQLWAFGVLPGKYQFPFDFLPRTSINYLMLPGQDLLSVQYGSEKGTPLGCFFGSSWTFINAWPWHVLGSPKPWWNVAVQGASHRTWCSPGGPGLSMLIGCPHCVFLWLQPLCGYPSHLCHQKRWKVFKPLWPWPTVGNTLYRVTQWIYTTGVCTLSFSDRFFFSHLKLLEIWINFINSDILPLLSHFNRVCLFVTPQTVSPPVSSVHRILQARILDWVAISFSRGSSWPRDQTRMSYVPVLVVSFVTTNGTWEVPVNLAINWQQFLFLSGT